MSGPSYEVNEITAFARKKAGRKESPVEEQDIEIESPRSGAGSKSMGKHNQCGKRARLKRTGSEGGAPEKPRATKTTGASRLKDVVAPCRQNTRSRRLVANARERSRIHILSDAFENLRRAVPSYSQDQKLSKLAILKLATYYISALANLAESDTSARSLKKFADCVAHCTKALQSEGRARRKLYDDDH